MSEDGMLLGHKGHTELGEHLLQEVSRQDCSELSIEITSVVVLPKGS